MRISTYNVARPCVQRYGIYENDIARPLSVSPRTVSHCATDGSLIARPTLFNPSNPNASLRKPYTRMCQDVIPPAATKPPATSTTPANGSYTSLVVQYKRVHTWLDYSHCHGPPRHYRFASYRLMPIRQSYESYVHLRNYIETFNEFKFWT